MEDQDNIKTPAKSVEQHVAIGPSTQFGDQHAPHEPEQPSHAYASTSPQHRHHEQPQMQTWHMPHPNLSISWHNNDRASGEMSSCDQEGHESDPSELLRPPVLFRNSHDRLPRLIKSTAAATPNEQDLFAMPQQPRTRRSMSLSLARSPWLSAGRNYRAGGLPPPHNLNHAGEVVPYSQEWRVILRSPPRGRTVLYNPEMQSLVVQTTIGRNSHTGMPLPMEESDRPICALCRRPLDPDTTVDEEDTSLSATSFMDSNYFRLLSEANQALSRRSTLQAPLRPPSATNTPTSSSRTSLDLDGATESDINPTSPQSRGDPAPLSHDALNQGYYERFFVEQVKLGKGYRGSVFLCQHILDGVFLGEYAIKKVAIGDNHDWLVQMLREVHLLERLHHPNIVSYKHAWLENHRLTKFGPEVACLFILMECANGGNLEEYIESLPEREYAAREASQGGQSSSSIDNTVRSESGMAEAKKPLSARERILQERRKQAAAAAAGASSPPSDNTAPKSNSKLQYLPITEVWSFFFDICEGLAHLHRLGIIHRDLKPPNLLLSYSDTRIKGSKGERPRVLISDFGECEVLDQAAKRDRTGATGTLEFLAPELLQVDEHGRYMNEFSFKGDMWSLGMILYYLCYSRLPYSQIDDVDLLKEEIRSFRSITLPEDESPDRIVPEELKILIRMLLSTDKSKRPSCDEILMTLTPQRERMARGGMNGSNPESSSAASKSTATSTNTATTDLHLFSTSGAISAPSSSSLGVSTIVRRRSRSGHRGQNAQDHLHHPQQQHVGTSISKTSGIRAPSKRVKPLGLGLRHMLRRRMMHYPSAESLYHATELSGARGRLSHFSERHPLQGPSQPYQSAPVRSTLGDTVISSVSPDERTEQQQDWNLKLATQASPAAGPSSRRTELQQQIRPNLMEDSNGPLRRSRRRRSQNSLEERDRSGEPTRGARIDNSKRQQDGSPPRSVRVAEKNAEDTGDGDAISVPPYSPSSPLSSSYWSALADNHSRHRGRGHSIKAIGEKQKRAYQPVSQSGTLADSEASEDSDEKSWKTDIPSLGVEGSSTLRHRRRHTASDVSDPDCVTEADRPSTLKATNNEELERGAADSGDGEVEDPQEGPSQALEKHSSFASSVDNFSEDTYPRQGHSWQSPLSAMMMFASLLARVWFSQRLCYPITVRPIVIYPLLTLTMVWDRYLLAILMGDTSRYHQLESGHRERARMPHTKHHRSRKSRKAHDMNDSSFNGDGYDRDVEDDDKENVDETRWDDDEDNDNNEEGDQSRLYNSTAGMMVGSFLDTQAVVALYHQERPDERRPPLLPPMLLSFVSSETRSLFWIAFAAGLGMQLLWVIGVWVMSGGQLCAAP